MGECLWLMCHILFDEAQANLTLLKDHQMLRHVRLFASNEHLSQNEIAMHIVSWFIELATKDLQCLEELDTALL